jgi:hypothetical protein
MRRIVGIAIFVIGLLIVVLGFGRILPGAGSTGVFVMLCGGVVFGLSFIKPHDPGPNAPPDLSPFEKITGVFFEPGRIFDNLRYHPQWLAAFLVIAVCGFIYQVTFTQRLTPEVIAASQIDKAIEGGWVPADKASEIREQAISAAKAPTARVTGPLNVVCGIFVALVVIAAIYLLAVMVSGGRIDFWQVLSVVMYAGLPPSVIQYVLSILLLYLKSPSDIDPIKGQRGLVRADLGLLFVPAEHPYLYTIMGFFGIITFYGLWLTATGLNHAGEKVSKGAAWGIAICLWFVGMVLALGAAALFPTFVS